MCLANKVCDLSILFFLICLLSVTLVAVVYPVDAYNISGYVLDTLGNPVSGVNVTISTSPVVYNLTDETGYYILTGISDGTYYVNASKEGYTTNSTTVTVSGSDITNHNITIKDIASPVIKINAAGNPNGGETYYYNGTWQVEDFIYINVTVTDNTAVDTVICQWYGPNGWQNYTMIHTVDDYWEISITNQPHWFGYTFNIWANDTLGNAVTEPWVYIGYSSSWGPKEDFRKYIGLNATPQAFEYKQYYLHEYHYSILQPLPHEQGTGTTADTGIMRYKQPQTPQERHCSSWVSFALDETEQIDRVYIENMYVHVWWKTDNDIVYIGYRKDIKTHGCPSTPDEGFTATKDTAVAYINVDYPSFIHNTYYLEARYYEFSTPREFRDNDINFFWLILMQSDNHPSVIDYLPHYHSFIILNLPDNATLQSLDTDSDNLSDYDELFVYFTDPGDSDTDDDGLTDYQEVIEGLRPVLPDTPHQIINMSPELSVVRFDNLSIDLTTAPQYGIKTALMKHKEKNVYGAIFDVDFRYSNVNLANVTFDVDLDDAKALLVNLTDIPEVSNVSILIPKKFGTNRIYVIPNVTSLLDVNDTHPSRIYLNITDENVSVVTINGVEYYKLSIPKSWNSVGVGEALCHIRDLARGYAVLWSNHSVDLSVHGTYGVRTILLGLNQYGDYVAVATINFTKPNGVQEDISFANVTLDISWSEAKSVIHGINEISNNVSLLIPRVYGTDTIYIVPGAKTLEEVKPDSPTAILLTVSDPNVDIVTIEGQRYYIVYNITGTGGGELLTSTTETTTTTATTTTTTATTTTATTTATTETTPTGVLPPEETATSTTVPVIAPPSEEEFSIWDFLTSIYGMVVVVISLIGGGALIWWLGKKAS